MTWAKEFEELRRREELADEMGGPDKVARQHSRGKMVQVEAVLCVVEPSSAED